MLAKKRQKMMSTHYTEVLAQGQARTETPWNSSLPVILIRRKKADQAVYPGIGVVHAANTYSQTLSDFCKVERQAQQALISPMVGNPKQLLLHPFWTHPTLTATSVALCSSLSLNNTEALTTFRALTEAQMTQDPPDAQKELAQLLSNLAAFLNGAYAQRSCCIEPYQKQLIMHTFFFLVSIRAPDISEELLESFKSMFGLLSMPSSDIQIFKQKATVFLIPRRHGKTWIVVALISMVLMSIEDVHIGYVAHQKHVASSVFTDVYNTLTRWCSAQCIEAKRDNGTLMYRAPGKRPSSLLCATCFNKNVRRFFLVFDTHRLGI